MPKQSSHTWLRSGLFLLVTLGVCLLLVLGSSRFSQLDMLAFSVDPDMSRLGDATNAHLCVHTKGGKHRVADSDGFVCSRQDVTPAGCCVPQSPFTDGPFSCSSCNQTAECCTEYENCVSCCLRPEHEIAVTSMMLAWDHPVYNSVQNNFEFCQARCRTSSESIYSNKMYRSSYKHCYGIYRPLVDVDARLTKPARELDTGTQPSKPLLTKPIEKILVNPRGREEQPVVEGTSSMAIDWNGQRDYMHSDASRLLLGRFVLHFMLSVFVIPLIKNLLW